MENDHSYENKCQVYPGEYIPLPEIEILLKNVKANEEGKVLVKVEESADFFEMEVNLPGLKRSEIFINVRDNILRIVSLHKNDHQCYSSRYSGIRCERIVKNIILPVTADAEFAHAEYNHGVVKVTIPKAIKTFTSNVDHIVVY